MSIEWSRRCGLLENKMPDSICRKCTTDHHRPSDIVIMTKVSFFFLAKDNATPLISLSNLLIDLRKTASRETFIQCCVLRPLNRTGKVASANEHSTWACALQPCDWSAEEPMGTLCSNFNWKSSTRTLMFDDVGLVCGVFCEELHFKCQFRVWLLKFYC